MGIAPDVLIRDRYHLLERIAVGSTGEVWRAIDLVLTRHVAVKILHAEWIDDRTFRERFRAEARNAARLSHPGVAEVHDYGEQGDLAFLVMEYLPGESLETLLERNRDRDAADGRPALSLDSTLEIVAQVARALQAAHDLGLIHRDIKPANLIVGPSGDVKITDFGTARALDASTVTEPGVIVGTAQYLSPEQAEGRPLTPATDIYTLGVVAYACLTGEPPFNGPSAVEIAAAHVHELPPALPEDTPPPVRELVGGCLAKDPASRPASAAELAGQCVASRAAIPKAASVREGSDRRRPAPVGAVAAGAALAFGGMLLFGPGEAFLPSTPVAADGQQIRLGDGPERPRPVPHPVGEDEAEGSQGADASASTPRRKAGGMHPYPAAPATRTSSSSSSPSASATVDDGRRSSTGGPSPNVTPGDPSASPGTSGDPTREEAPSPFSTSVPPEPPAPFSTPIPSRTTLEGGPTSRPPSSPDTPRSTEPTEPGGSGDAPTAPGSGDRKDSAEPTGTPAPSGTSGTPAPSGTTGSPRPVAPSESVSPTPSGSEPQSTTDLLPSIAELVALDGADGSGR